jgi:hypothetical protein
MTPKRHQSSSAGINLNNVRDVAIASGENAQANNKVNQAGSPVDAAVLARIEQELSQLRQQLADLHESGSDQLAADSVDAAAKDIEVIEGQVHAPQPDAEVITRHLGRLSMVLVGVTGVTDNLARLTRSLGSLVGLG